MVDNVNPTDPKFIDENDLDTGGHRQIAAVTPTEADIAGLKPLDHSAEDDDTEGHRIVTDVSPTEEDAAGLRPLNQSSEDEDPEGFYGRL